VGRIAEQIGLKVIDNGWKSYIAFSRGPSSGNSNLLRIGTAIDVYWHGLQTRLFDNHGFSSSSATRKLIKSIDRIKPDIIHLHHLHGYFVNIQILFDFLRTAGIPVVWTHHDCWAITGHCAYFDYIGCEKWKTLCFSCPQQKSYPASFLQDRSSLNYNLKKIIFGNIPRLVMVPVSHWLASVFNQSFLKDYPTTVIQNGVNLENFKFRQEGADKVRAKLNAKNKFLILGVASTWDRRKGLQDFLNFQREYRLNHAVLLLIGLSKSQLKNLPSGILGIERTENVQELADYYSAADVFVNPTWEDTFPTTNLESLACGTPVITYRTGGAVESITNETGAVIEKGDLRNLKKTLEYFQCLDETQRARFRANCRLRAENFFDMRTRFDDYVSLYNSMLSQP
jgi:glycosyltransferase involved in cell wall biosynthesis